MSTAGSGADVPAQMGVKAPPTAAWVFVHAKGLSLKTLLAEKHTRPDVARRRALEGPSDTDRAPAPGVHPRDLDQDSQGVPAWLGAARKATTIASSSSAVSTVDLGTFPSPCRGVLGP